MLSSSSDDFPVLILLELVRVTLIAGATWLLQSGYARGGPGELQALAEVRIDAADGSLDGYSDTVAVDGSTETVKVGVSYRDIERVTEFNRRRFRAERVTGNYLPSFMLFDFCSLGLILAVGIGSHLWRIQATTASVSDPMFWTSCYYMKMYYALMSFPFLVFIIPIFGEALHGANATGYDKSGLLVPRLSSDRIRQKKELESQRRAEQEQMAGDAWMRARVAWRLHPVRRWARAILGISVLFAPVRNML